jgi:rhodanese-related sulfurtransferase
MRSSGHPTSVEELLAEARAQLIRVTPGEAIRKVREGAVLIDIRSESQRRGDGLLPDSVFVPRNVLQWRLDPASSYAAPELAHRGRALSRLCNAGYQSSPAAATLRRFGVDATDVIGGFQAWRNSGLPVGR